jgi:hypothetical protein
MQRIPPLTMYRVEVAWLLDAGEQLGDIKEEIGRITDLTQEERDELRRFALERQGRTSRGSRKQRKRRSEPLTRGPSDRRRAELKSQDVV